MSSIIDATTSEQPADQTVREALVVSPVPLRSGGLGTAAAEFADGLEALGHRWAFVGAGRPGPATRVAGGRVFRRLFGSAPSRRLTARAVRRAVPERGWDLAYAIPGSLPESRGSGIQVLLQATRHPAVEWRALREGERETGGRGDMSRAECRRRERELARADLVHVTSLAVRDELLDAGIPAERLVHSCHGVDTARFTAGPKAEDLRVAFVGPLSLRKGIDVVAALATRLQGEATVETVGGPTCPWSRRIAEAAPFVARDSVLDMLREAQVLVLPSRSDGFSYVVLEAMASGTIPFVTPEVGAAEIVHRLDERLVIEREEFVATAATLLSELDFDVLGRRARALAEELDRKVTSKAVAAAVLARAETLRPR
jgi:glycosyltransferase involved in cell wall biosynthesis